MRGVLESIPFTFKTLTVGVFGKSVAALLAAFIAWLLPTETVQALALMMLSLVVLDTLTGVRAAYVTGVKIQSAKLNRVLSKLLGYFAILLVGVEVGYVMERIFHAKSAIGMTATMVLVFALLTEAVSILENVRKMGIAFPTWLLRLAKRLLKETDEQPPK